MGPGTLSDHLLERFLAFSRDHRGLSASTREDHRLFLRRFFAFLREGGVTEARRIPVYVIDAFIQKLAASVGLGRLHSAAGALRAFFRFLSIHRLIRPHIQHAVILPRKVTNTIIQKSLPWSQVQELLRRVPRHSFLGKRDFAVLLLFAYHGLRSWEVATLRLNDIRWNSNSIFLRRRKNGRAAHLPLSPAALQALKDYVAVRPQVSFPEVFVTRRTPFRPLGSHTYAVARRHLQRCFGASIGSPRGAYRLRHSFAKMLLDRGAPLPQIGQLMGHQNLDSTLIYTRVATDDLRQVADNYADLL